MKDFQQHGAINLKDTIITNNIIVAEGTGINVAETTVDGIKTYTVSEEHSDTNKDLKQYNSSTGKWEYKSIKEIMSPYIYSDIGDDGTIIANGTSLTTLKTITIPAEVVEVGDILEVDGYFQISNTSSSPSTRQLKLVMDGAVLYSEIINMLAYTSGEVKIKTKIYITSNTESFITTERLLGAVVSEPRLFHSAMGANGIDISSSFTVEVIGASDSANTNDVIARLLNVKIIK